MTGGLGLRWAFGPVERGFYFLLLFFSLFLAHFFFFNAALLMNPHLIALNDGE